MKPVNQTKFKGSDAPIEEQGDCFMACLASILELSIDEVFDDKIHPEGHWFDELNKWLVGFNLGCIHLPARINEAGNFAPGTTYLGYHIMEFESVNLKPGDGHVCVSKDGTVVHNPHPDQGIEDVGEYKGVFLLVSLDVAELHSVTTA